MSYDKVLSETITLIDEHLDEPVEVTEASRFDSDLAFDSIQVMDLVADIEDHFDITIPLNDLPAMQTVGQTAKRLVEIIEQSS